MAIEDTIAALRKRIEEVEAAVAAITSALNTETIQKRDMDRIRAELVQLKDSFSGADETSTAAMETRVESLEETLAALTSSINAQTVSKSDMDRVRGELVQLKDALGAVEETSDSALKTRVDALETILAALTANINAQVVSKDDLDRLRAELVQLKAALSRGDFGEAATVAQGLDALVNEQVALTSQTRSLLDSVRDEVTAISTDVASNLALIRALQRQVAMLIIRVTDVVGPMGPVGAKGDTGPAGPAGPAVGTFWHPYLSGKYGEVDELAEHPQYAPSGEYVGLSGNFTTHRDDTTNPHDVIFAQARDQEGGSDVTLAELEQLSDGSNAAALHYHSGEYIQTRTLGSPTLDNFEEMHDYTQSAGSMLSGQVIDNGDGTFDVSGGQGLIRDADSSYGTLYSVEWNPAYNISANDDAITYVYVDYNSGSPVIATTTTRATISDNREICIGHVYKEAGLNMLHIRHAGVSLMDFQRRVDRRIKDLRYFERTTGMVISETGQRYVTLTAGIAWRGLDKFLTPAMDTSGSDTFSYYHRDGAGGWTKVTGQTQIDNTQYDNNGLTPLGTGRYGIHWVFYCAGQHLDVIYGQGSYKLAEAVNASIPADLPDKIVAFGVIIAKIIIRKSATSFADVSTVFETIFHQHTVINHGDLGDLQGGAADEYYHLTLAQHSEAISVSGDLATHEADTANPHSVTFNQARDETGGSDVTLIELEELTDGSGTALHTHADTLDVVCDRGSETDQDIHTSGVIIADQSGLFDSVFINPAGPDADSFLYFYEDGVPASGWFKWSHAYNRFECSHEVVVWGDIKGTGDLYFNAGGPEGDGTFYFYEAGVDQGAYIKWQDSVTSFLISHEMRVGGHIFAGRNMGINYSASDNDAVLVFYKPSSGAEYLKWNKTTTRFEFTDVLSMESHKIVSVTDPTADQDAATKKYVDDHANLSRSFEANGAYWEVTAVDGAWILDSSKTITAVWLYRGTAGDSGNTVVDIHKNGTTIYSTQGNRPTIAYDDGDNKVDCTLPDVTSIAAGDVLTVDIDSVEGGDPADLSIIIHVE